ncbi:MAG: hypothetical protein KF725_15550 [Cyclobacteriaceae bacterium]|nr:hypothetical protein [Cyclobacteriaceae bacterium]UYN87753.1 MAG: hypothetical protein KIT51_05730 [Cyclobacteriaceae bacterium]
MKTLKVILLLVFSAALLTNCDTKEKQQLQSKVDSLQVELQTAQQMASTLQEVGQLMDEIDATRNVLRANVVEGTTHNDYQARMTEIHSYIKDIQNRITELEATAKKSTVNYAATIKRLKKDLELRNEQLLALQEEVTRVRNENDLLTVSINQKNVTLAEQQQIIKLKEDDVMRLEKKLDQITIASQTSKADLYFAQARALETAAERTKFAPKKKKETQREALELYRQAHSLGKQEAQLRIEELEKILS